MNKLTQATDTTEAVQDAQDTHVDEIPEDALDQVTGGYGQPDPPEFTTVYA